MPLRQTRTFKAVAATVVVAGTAVVALFGLFLSFEFCSYGDCAGGSGSGWGVAMTVGALLAAWIGLGAIVDERRRPLVLAAALACGPLAAGLTFGWLS